MKLGSTPANIVSWRDTKVEFGVPAYSGNGITLQNTMGQVSNGLPFTTRSGRILFVSKSTVVTAITGLRQPQAVPASDPGAISLRP